MSGARLSVAAALLLMVSTVACGGGDDSGDSSDASTTEALLDGDPIDLPGSDFDAGSFDLPADAAITTTSPPGCAAPALTCSDPFPGSLAYSSAIAADIVGVWIYCGDAGSGGFELAANGTAYQVIQNADGDYVPDLDPFSMGEWTISAGTENGYSGGPLQLLIGGAGGTAYDDVGLSTCPRALLSGEGMLALPAR